jgi:hypothetical protein
VKVREIEQHIASLHGEMLLHELVTFAALHLDAAHNKEEDNVEAITRAIEARLAETGIARKYHGEKCRFMLGDDHCPCSIAGWSWHRKGLGDPSMGDSRG